MAGSDLGQGRAESDAVLRRVESMLLIARQHQTGVPVRELTSLLSEEGPRSDAEMRSWIEQHPGVATLRADLAVHPSVDRLPSDTLGRLERGRRYLALARGLLTTQFRLVAPLLRVVSVTGSTAYGEPEPGDDLDLLVIVRDGALWVFLSYAYVVLRLRPLRDGPAERVTSCLNYVATEREARVEFSAPQGLLFAREALTARSIHGEEEYRRLLESARWMQLEFPRLYDSAVRRSAAPGIDGRAPALIRVANLAVFPWLAAYLHLLTLWRNHWFRVRGATDRTYRTITTLDRLFFRSAEFEHLRAEYERAAVPAGGSAA